MVQPVVSQGLPEKNWSRDYQGGCYDFSRSPLAAYDTDWGPLPSTSSHNDSHGFLGAVYASTQCTILPETSTSSIPTTVTNTLTVIMANSPPSSNAAKLSDSTAAPNPFDVRRLPNEIITLVALHALNGNPRTVYSLMLTCTRFYPSCERILYRRVQLTAPNQLRDIKFTERLATRPDLACAVRELSLALYSAAKWYEDPAFSTWKSRFIELADEYGLSEELNLEALTWLYWDGVGPLFFAPGLTALKIVERGHWKGDFSSISTMEAVGKLLAMSLKYHQRTAILKPFPLLNLKTLHIASSKVLPFVRSAEFLKLPRLCMLELELNSASPERGMSEPEPDYAYLAAMAGTSALQNLRLVVIAPSFSPTFVYHLLRTSARGIRGFELLSGRRGKFRASTHRAIQAIIQPHAATLEVLRLLYPVMAEDWRAAEYTRHDMIFPMYMNPVWAPTPEWLAICEKWVPSECRRVDLRTFGMLSTFECDSSIFNIPLLDSGFFHLPTDGPPSTTLLEIAADWTFLAETIPPSCRELTVHSAMLFASRWRYTDTVRSEGPTCHDHSLLALFLPIVAHPPANLTEITFRPAPEGINQSPTWESVSAWWQYMAGRFRSQGINFAIEQYPYENHVHLIQYQYDLPKLRRIGGGWDTTREAQIK
ncbi:hypothetical protein EJ06DRAFT_585195 [Trichodelitschia bisporula]|uniref:Uncharacterized protein n=1 Tax=Trichodelitschia bisporula TaxID=703511 RepID=A0A6G1HKJ7_9PEZI|nr:hypothetical protein EJ06DRAFT_585195 [Trichodelitschia bisporula]